MDQFGQINPAEFRSIRDQEIRYITQIFQESLPSNVKQAALLRTLIIIGEAANLLLYSNHSQPMDSEQQLYYQNLAKIRHYLIHIGHRYTFNHPLALVHKEIQTSVFLAINFLELASHLTSPTYIQQLATQLADAYVTLSRDPQRIQLKQYALTKGLQNYNRLTPDTPDTRASLVIPHQPTSEQQQIWRQEHCYIIHKTIEYQKDIETYNLEIVKLKKYAKLAYARAIEYSLINIVECTKTLNPFLLYNGSRQRRNNLETNLPYFSQPIFIDAEETKNNYLLKEAIIHSITRIKDNTEQDVIISDRLAYLNGDELIYDRENILKDLQDNLNSFLNAKLHNNFLQTDAQIATYYLPEWLT